MCGAAKLFFRSHGATVRPGQFKIDSRSAEINSTGGCGDSPYDCTAFRDTPPAAEVKRMRISDDVAETPPAGGRWTVAASAGGAGGEVGRQLPGPACGGAGRVGAGGRVTSVALVGVCPSVGVVGWSGRARVCMA